MKKDWQKNEITVNLHLYLSRDATIPGRRWMAFSNLHDAQISGIFLNGELLKGLGFASGISVQYVLAQAKQCAILHAASKLAA